MVAAFQLGGPASVCADIKKGQRQQLVVAWELGGSVEDHPRSACFLASAGPATAAVGKDRRGDRRQQHICACVSAKALYHEWLVGGRCCY